MDDVEDVAGVSPKPIELDHDQGIAGANEVEDGCQFKTDVARLPRDLFSADSGATGLLISCQMYTMCLDGGPRHVSYLEIDP